MTREELRTHIRALANRLIPAILVGLLFLSSNVFGAGPTLKNGSMTEGGKLPTGWGEPAVDAGSTGKLVAERDTTVYVKGPASIRLESVGGSISGKVTQMIKGVGGKSLEFSGHVRHAEGKGSAVVALIGFSGDFKPIIGWKEVGKTSDESDWRPFNTRVDFPAEVKQALLLLYVRGQGKAWFDEISVAEVSRKAPSAPPSDIAAERVLHDFSEGFTFSFNDFKKGVEKSDHALRISNTKDAGGAGIVKRLDMRGYEKGMLTLRARIGDKHESLWLNIHLQDDNDNNAVYKFSTREDVERGKFITLLPADWMSVEAPEKFEFKEGQKSFDFGAIKTVMVFGAWQGRRMDIELDELAVMRDTPKEFIVAREEAARKRAERERAAAERKRREAEAKERRKQELLSKGAKHEEDGPVVLHVGAVAPDLLAITIQEREYHRTQQIPYEPKEGDEIRREGKHELLALEHGKIVKTLPSVYVYRLMGDHRGKDVKLRRYGALAVNQNLVKPADYTTGKDVETSTVEEPAAYRIASMDDGTYRKPQQPLQVFWKRKPNAPDTNVARSQVFLVLPKPLVEGKRYRVEFKGINTSQAAVDYKHEPSKTRSIAVHASHVGYRPDDPHKRALLSIWLGTGGGCTYGNHASMRFHVLDETSGKPAYSGNVKRLFSAEENENFQNDRNHGKTDTYALDFSEFNTPGRYRVYVEGVGCSYPFDISQDAWERALRVSLRGFLAQRSGLELNPPLVPYHRPRNMHPADGAKIFASKATVYDGQGQDGVFGAIQKDEFRTDESLDDAWGGYHDAADWDRRARGHLPATYQLIELFELFPDYYAALKLALPEDEANNRIPDILDEAEWNLGLFRRMQEADGGVRGGIESTSHPRKGEASWQESLMMAAFAPDANASYTFSFTAAKFSRALKGHDDKLAKTYFDAAIRAFDWAEANHDTVLKNVTSEEDRQKQFDKSLRAPQNLAAVELYWMTGDKRYHEVFKHSTTLAEDGNPDYGQRNAYFAYARLPDTLADPTLKSRARDAVIKMADDCIEFGRGNSFGISMAINLPSMGWVGYMTKPGVGSNAMPRAYYLTGDRKYLAGAIAATQFSIGVNPSNIALTTGLGPNPVKYPMFIDSKNTGQFDAPDGITVYGISDPAMNYDFDSWVHTYKLKKMTPKSRTWPAAESYWDIHDVPSTNEYQPHVMAASAYYWGFLAARD